MNHIPSLFWQESNLRPLSSPDPKGIKPQEHSTIELQKNPTNRSPSLAHYVDCTRVTNWSLRGPHTLHQDRPGEVEVFEYVVEIVVFDAAITPHAQIKNS